MNPQAPAFHDLRSVFWLSSRDYRHEWRMSSCFVLALAAVLAPMLVLFGLKFGIVTSMLDRLVEDPRTREIRPVGSGRFGPDWFDDLRSRPEVGFVMPRTRSLAATIKLYNPEAPRIVAGEMIPSGPGDPLLGAEVPHPRGLHEVVLSDSAARKLSVSAGDTLDGSLARSFRGQRERVHVPLTVTAVAGPESFSRDGAFVSLELLVAAEDFRDGRAVSALGWEGDPAAPDERSFPGYRLYARSIYDVAGLRDDLETDGLEVRTSAADIEIVQAMDRNFSFGFWIIALVGLVGYSLSLGASLWANVDRKRRELSVLRLVGVQTAEIVWFPVFQALFTGLLGWLLAGLIYLGVAQTINRLLAPQLEAGTSVCRLLPAHFIVAMVFTLWSAVIAAGLSGYRVARIEPSEGLREV